MASLCSQSALQSGAGLLQLGEVISDLYLKTTSIRDLAGIHQDVIELQNLLTVASLIAKAGRARKENVGGHYLVADPLYYSPDMETTTEADLAETEHGGYRATQKV